MNVIEKIVKKKLIGDSRKVDKRSQRAFEAALLAQGVSKGRVKSAVKKRKAAGKAALKKALRPKSAEGAPAQEEKGARMLKMASAAVVGAKILKSCINHRRGK